MLEIPEIRTAASKTFKLDNGLYRTEAGCHSHVQKSGLFVPVNSLLDVERGTDPDTGRAYEVSNHSTQHPFYFKFAPDCLKIKHIDSDSMVCLMPRDFNPAAEFGVEGDHIYVRQLWTGIDVQFTVFDRGLKADYTITAKEGQRVVEIGTAITGSRFRIGRMWFKASAQSPLPVFIPQVHSNDVLTLDFRNVPLGTVVDPSLTIQPDSTTSQDGPIEDSNPNTNYDGVITLIAGDANSGASAWRSLIKFDLSSLALIASSINSASLNLTCFDITKASAGSPATTTVKVYRLLVPFTANQVTWNNRVTGTAWTSSGADHSNDIDLTELDSITKGVGGTGLHTWNMSTFASNVFANTWTNYGFAIWAPEWENFTGGANYLAWRDSEYAVAAERPYMTFDYVALSSGGSGARTTAKPTYPFAPRGGSNYPFKTR